MKDYSGWEKNFLRSQAHHLKPVIHIGKLGYTDTLIEAISKSLDDHELIKIKFIGFKDEKKEIADKIAETADALICGMIGNILILYRENRDRSKRKIIIPVK